MNITKEEFIIRLKLVVMADERSCVEDITYWKQDEKEVVTIRYVGGAKAMINVACNSNGCNALEIMREIYGSGAIGKIREEELQEGASFFTQHFPDCYKVAGCQRIAEHC